MNVFLTLGWCAFILLSKTGSSKRRISLPRWSFHTSLSTLLM